MVQATGKVGKGGAVIIPPRLRRRFGLEQGAIPLEMYSTERRAEFLLNNAVDAESYAEALAEVRNMGLDPDKIPHQKPPGI
jgi:bifunctional DNA-binding transcriptional regulator/antitoxin component of YhaV-PrlF toxin-antitoxin module